jgi:hypothetical protein
MAGKKTPEPLGQVEPSRQAKQEQKKTTEIQREAALENLTNVPDLASAGGVASGPSMRATKPREFGFESPAPETRVFSVNGNAVLRFDGPEEWAAFQRKVRAAT